MPLVVSARVDLALTAMIAHRRIPHILERFIPIPFTVQVILITVAHNPNQNLSTILIDRVDV